MFSKNKKEVFLNESINMFSELKVRNKKGNKINYSTVSHGKTLGLLKRLEKNGYVENLNYSFKKKSRLFLARLMIGNTNNINNKKKYSMYNISFNLTDKERKKEALIELMNTKEDVKKEEENNKKTIEEKKVEINNNEEIRNKIRELENLKEQLLYPEEEIKNKRGLR